MLKRLTNPLFLLTFLLGLASAGAIAACHSSFQTTSPLVRGDVSTHGEVLKMLYWQAPNILNPHLSTGYKDSEASRLTLEPLATFNAEDEMEPVLAATVPSLDNGKVTDDGLSVIWQLKEDIQWSDGEPFTADDVIFTYEYLSNPDTAAITAANYQIIDRISKLSDNTVQIHFREPNPAWSIPFVGADGVILPKHVFENYIRQDARSAPGNTMPVGTGPYRVIEFIPGDRVVYEPNPYFREDSRPYFPRVELKGGGDAASAARAVLQTGDTDFAYNLQIEPAILKQLEEGGQGKAHYVFGPAFERIQINFSDPAIETNGQKSHKETPHPFLSDR